MQGAGQGLFADRDFKVMEKIGVYWGSIVSLSQAERVAYSSERLVASAFHTRHPVDFSKVGIYVDGSPGCYAGPLSVFLMSLFLCPQASSQDPPMGMTFA